MNKLMLLSGAALFALSNPATAQSVGSEPSPDAAASAPAPADAASPPAADAPAPAPDTAAPGVAQSPPPAADAAATTPAAPAVAQTVPATDTAATTDTGATTDTAATTQAAPATASADATAKVNADWAKYDEGNKGKLTALEFGTWNLAAKGQDMTAQVEKTKTSKRANLPAVKVLNATAADFSKADTDKDKMISPTELAVFLSA